MRLMTAVPLSAFFMKNMGPYEAVMWHAGGELVYLDALIPPTSDVVKLYAYHINKVGQICGEATLRNNKTRGFVLTPKS